MEILKNIGANVSDIDRTLWKDRIGTGVASVVMGGIMGAPTSALLVGYIGEFANIAVGRPLGEWGGWRLGFGIGEVASMAAVYIIFREGQREYDSRRWKLPHFNKW